MIMHPSSGQHRPEQLHLLALSDALQKHSALLLQSLLNIVYHQCAMSLTAAGVAAQVAYSH